MAQQVSSNELETNLLRGWGILNTVITTTGTPSVLASSVDVSGILSPGDKIWIVQSTNKYVYVLAVDATTITVTQSTDYTIVGTGVTAISAIYFSKHATPYGFPTSFTYVPSWTGSTTNPAINNGTITGKFTMNGRWATVVIEIVAGTTTTFGSGRYAWGLPFVSASRRFVGIGNALRTGLAFVFGPAVNADFNWTLTTGLVSIIQSGGVVSSTTQAWANTDVFNIEITYEAG